jgi:prophage regulatory protein
VSKLLVSIDSAALQGSVQMTIEPSGEPRIERILDKKELRKYIPYTPQHIARLEKAGQFPKRVQLGPSRVGWLESEIIAWIEQLKRKRNLPKQEGNVIRFA